MTAASRVVRPGLRKSLALAGPQLTGESERHEQPALFGGNVWMRYGGTVALRDVTLNVVSGTIHALVGQNGAGKSTFLNIAAGRVQPSAGSLAIYGQPLHRASPRAARRLGVAAIYQELTLVPAMTALANVFLGNENTKFGLLSRGAMRSRFTELRDQLGVDIPPSVPAGELSVADQQALEIMRGLQEDARLLLLDEPTSALGRAERERLFVTIRRLKQRGVTAVFVSHDLGDVLDLADVVSVFRDGEIVETRPAAAWTHRALVAAMLGGTQLGQIRTTRSTSARTPNVETEKPPTTEADGSHALSVEHLSVPGIFRDISFHVDRGEILGIGGLVGSGRSTLLRCLSGDGGKRASGEMTLGGRRTRLPKSPAHALRNGIAYIPEDRRTHGLVRTMSALENIMLPEFRGNPLALVSRRSSERRAHAATIRVGFDPSRLGSDAETLSGGNQQKLLLARWVSRTNMQVLLADEPTRGIDVGAKAEILHTLHELASTGLAIIVVSSEFEDLEAIANRVLVLSAGRVVTQLKRSRAEITSARILGAAFGTPSTEEG